MFVLFLDLGLRSGHFYCYFLFFFLFGPDWVPISDGHSCQCRKTKIVSPETRTLSFVQSGRVSIESICRSVHLAVIMHVSEPLVL